MTRVGPPVPEEWNTDGLPFERRFYLNSQNSFENIAGLIAAEAKVQRVEIRPFESTRDKQEKTARQIVFRVKVSSKNCDLFYNAPDGLRGRYWQSPDAGFLATRCFIDVVKSALLYWAKDATPTKVGNRTRAMSIDEMQASLDASTAKVWPCETDWDGNQMPYKGKPQLSVRRWELNEATGPKGPLWRWTPDNSDLEIKGALLDPEGREYIPESKRDRSCQIHLYGFT